MSNAKKKNKPADQDGLFFSQFFLSKQCLGAEFNAGLPGCISQR